jgi:peptidoglycan hydrolase-like protein with peptidoglycan-binding domain
MALYRKGSSGEDVVRIQKALKEKGFLKGDADGDFGGKTEAAVMAFQSKNGLEADGVVGPGTWKVLFDEGTPKVEMPPGPYVITPDHLSAIAGLTTKLMPGLSEWLN